MAVHHHRKLLASPSTAAGDTHFWAVLCGSEPPSDLAFKSDHLQIIYNNTSIPWQDEVAHAHTESDEVYVVQEGTMVVAVSGVRVDVKAGEFLCVPAGTFHQLVEVTVPVKSFVIRSPSVKDKISAPQQSGRVGSASPRV